MSILKVILHRWNKTTKSHDAIHPETEVAQVTDWNQGIVNTLASTALGGLVNTLTSDSLLAKMIQKVLTATGVKYSMGQNGYICFGSLFGGLIIQWVSLTITTNNNSASTAWPIQFNNVFRKVGSRNADSAASQFEAYDSNNTIVKIHVSTKATGDLTYHIIGIGN